MIKHKGTIQWILALSIGLVLVPTMASASGLINPGISVVLPTAKGEKTIALGSKTTDQALADISALTLKKDPAHIHVKSRGFTYTLKTSNLQLRPNPVDIVAQASVAATDTVIAINYVSDSSRATLLARVVSLSKKLNYKPKSVRAAGGARLTNFGGRTIDAEATTNKVVSSLNEYGTTKDKTPSSVKVASSVSIPKVKKNSGRLVVVSLTQRTVFVFKGNEVLGYFPIAIGGPGYRTPTGTYRIGRKALNPTWNNPGASWSAGMPGTISGALSPLGVAALYVYKGGRDTGLRFHGTLNEPSVGTAASHGCMRMIKADVKRMYKIVPVGTPVSIIK